MVLIIHYLYSYLLRVTESVEPIPDVFGREAGNILGRSLICSRAVYTYSYLLGNTDLIVFESVCLWAVEGNQSSQKKPMWAERVHRHRTERPQPTSSNPEPFCCEATTRTIAQVCRLATFYAVKFTGSTGRDGTCSQRLEWRNSKCSSTSMPSQINGV